MPGRYALQAEAGLRATGGGFVLRDGAKVTFAVTARADGAAPRALGEVTVVDHATHRTFHGQVTTMTCANGVTTLGGTLAAPDQGTFQLTLEDHGERGSADAISFSTSAGYAAAGTLTGGNIQLAGACPVVPSPSACHTCEAAGSFTLGSAVLNIADASGISYSDTYLGSGTFDYAFGGNQNVPTNNPPFPEGDDHAGTFTLAFTSASQSFVIKADTATVTRCYRDDETTTFPVIVNNVDGLATLTFRDGSTLGGRYSFATTDELGSGPDALYVTFDFYCPTYSVTINSGYTDMTGTSKVDSPCGVLGPHP